METVYFTYGTIYGTGAVVSGERGVRRHILPRYRGGNELIQAEGLEDLKYKEDKRLSRALLDYFNAKKIVTWPITLDLSGYPYFFRDIYFAVVNIKYGERASYKAVTSSIGRPSAYRAAGNALGRNNTPLFIPCHRVVRSGGEPGGWSGPAGWKKILLRIEKDRDIPPFEKGGPGGI